MKILVDENIPLVEAFFSDYGELLMVPGRAIKKEMVQDVDVLLVRSVTPVDNALLRGSKVAFVGSATIGMDHVDEAYLAANNISYTSAPGCNANSVAEYVLCSLLRLMKSNSTSLRGLKAAVVGYGNVGKAVFKKLEAVGVRCVAVDPLLKNQGERDHNNNHFVGLDDVLSGGDLSCDVVCLHTPLIFDEPYPTFHLLGDEELRRLKPGVILLNAGRGATIDNRALDAYLSEGCDMQVVLDVWENEPNINRSLLGKVDLATPHIAGYSMDGKWRGTQMLYDAFCHWQGREIKKRVGQFVSVNRESMSCKRGPLNDSSLLALCESFYDVSVDDDNLRANLGLDEVKGDQSVSSFDDLRKHYPVRREFNSKDLSAPGMSKKDRAVLQELGFDLASL